ncbi:hypothetical protein Tco_0588249 [Tanacetum coccineum]
MANVPEEIIHGSTSQFAGNDVSGSGSSVMVNGVNGFIPSVIANGVDRFVSEVRVNDVSGFVPGVVYVNESGSGVMVNGVNGSLPSVIANVVDRFVSEVRVDDVSGSVSGVVVNGVMGNGVGGSAAEVVNDGVSVIGNDVGGFAAQNMINGASRSVSEIGVNGVGRLVSQVEADYVIANGVGGSVGPGMSNGVSGSVASATQVDKDRLLRYFNQEVHEDIARLREYRAIASGLRITVRRRRERIRRLEALGNCQDAINVVSFWEQMQFEDVEKGTRALLIMREMEAKIREKARAAVEDGSLAREINGLCDGLTARIEEREYFIEELDTLADLFVPDKMAEFLKETQDKDRNRLMRLQILGREFE